MLLYGAANLGAGVESRGRTSAWRTELFEEEGLLRGLGVNTDILSP